MITLCSEMKISPVSHIADFAITITTVLQNKVSVAFEADFLSKDCPTSGATFHGPYLVHLSVQVFNSVDCPE